jgi:hypothetical protein
VEAANTPNPLRDRRVKARGEVAIHLWRAGAHRVDERGELEVLLADRLAGEDAIQRGKLGELLGVQVIA